MTKQGVINQDLNLFCVLQQKLLPEGSQMTSPNYRGDLKSGLVWILNGQKQFGLQMVWILNGICNPEAQPFEIRTKSCLFVKKNI